MNENKGSVKCPYCGQAIGLVKTEANKETEKLGKIDDAENFDELDKAMK